MQGVEKAHCNAVITAITKAAYAFWGSTVEEALRPILKYGKSDTLGMDAMPEIMIISALQEYDARSIVITEEVGSQGKLDLAYSDNPHHFRTVFISDPTDRSSQIKKSLEAVEDKEQTVSVAMASDEFRNNWERNFGRPVSITGGASAITCVRRGIPIFSVIVSYITRRLFLACSAGCYYYDLSPGEPEINLESVLLTGKKIFFNDANSPEDMLRFVTFMGKQGYKENFLDSRFMVETEIKKNLYYDLPGGPSRVLYLSDLQSAKNRIGFILANGEKITEWIHWLPYLRFARKANDQGAPALRLFEVYQDRPWTREGILMSTPPAYSIFQAIGSDGRKVIDINRFASFNNPSQIRSTLILAPASNHWATRVVNQYGYRPIEFYSE